MALKCKIGLHSWKGCKCTECEKTRNEEHDWSSNCEKCSICGKAIENKHDWSKDCNKCSKCGIKIKEAHSWINEKCSKCGKNIWESDNPKIRLSSIENISDESVLFKLAKEDKDNDVILAAIRKISNQSFLTEYAKFGEGYTSDRIQAIKKINNQELLRDIVLFGKNRNIRSDAVSKIEDQAFLKELVRNIGLDDCIRNNAVSKIEDQSFLKEVVINKDYGEDIRCIAICKIPNQVFLYDIAKNDSVDLEIRIRSIVRLHDQDMLKQIALLAKAKNEIETSKIRNLAVDQVKDENILKEKQSKNLKILELAFGQISDQNFLNELAKDVNYDVKVRLTASKYITNQILLQDFILNSTSGEMEKGVERALDRIDNQSFIIEIAQNTQNRFNDYVVWLAIRKVEDQNALKDIFNNSTSSWLKSNSLERISDQTFLEEIAKGNFEESLRIIAINKIVNPTLIIDCIKNDKSGLILNSAASRIFELDGKSNMYSKEKELIKSRLFEDGQIHIYAGWIPYDEASRLTNSNQIWMTENLNVFCFRNGDEILEADSEEKWLQYGRNEKPAYCYYDFDCKNENYGKLYNWYAVADHRNIVPNGWRLPTDNELFILEEFIKHPKYCIENIKMEVFSLKFVGYSYEKGVFSGTNFYSKFWCRSNYDNPYWAYILEKNYYIYGRGGGSIQYISKEGNNGFSLLCIKD